MLTLNSKKYQLKKKYVNINERMAAGNCTYKKLAVHWLNETLCFISSSALTDKIVNVIYRGWMLTPKQYSILYNDLLSKNYKLINTREEYQNCHYLPDSLKFIENRIPKTVFEKFKNEKNVDKLIEKSKVFGQKSVILKNYVKSEKHDWETTCFVADASNTDKFKQKINKLIELRDKYLK